MLHSFCPYVFLLFSISACYGLQIHLPDTTPLGADTTVELISQQGDPQSFYLKTTCINGQVPGNYFLLVDSIPSDKTVVLNFPTPDQYFVQAITGTGLSKPGQPSFATSNNVTVTRGSDCSSKNSTGAIVGILFGITFLLVCANIAIYMFIRRRRRQSSSSSSSPSSMSSFRGYLASRYYGSPPQPVMSPAPSIMSFDPYTHIKEMPTAHASLGYGSRKSAITIPLPLFDAPRSFTDRQMQIRQRIYELQSVVLRLEMKAGGGGGGNGMGENVRLDTVNDEVDVLQLKTKIGTLNDYLESAWAMHQSNIMPPELAACF